MKLNILVLTLTLTCAQVYATAPEIQKFSRSTTTQAAANKKARMKANVLTALKAVGFTALGYYLADFAFGYIDAGLKERQLDKFGTTDTNVLVKSIFTKPVYALTGVWGLYAVMRLTGNVSEFNETDIDAGFMATGRDSASSPATQAVA